MGFVRVPVLIGRDEASVRELTCLVGTGAFFTMLSPELAAELGIEATLEAPVVPAKAVLQSEAEHPERLQSIDNRMQRLNVGIAFVRLMGRESAVPVGVMTVVEPLLGVTTLEALGLKVNPVAQTLEIARPYGPAVF